MCLQFGHHFKNVTSKWDNEDDIPLTELRLQLAEDISNIQAISSLLQKVEPLHQLFHSEIEQWIVEPTLESFVQNEVHCANDDNLSDG